jgi:A/G-specific adenine glycosylase
MREKDIFSKPLILWYLKNRRDLPWRKSRDPYRIWLSEIILQQTRIAQGTDYYEKFTAEFDTVFELAAASEEQVLKLWQGLGYYSRARNLHETARELAEGFDGKFPENYKGLVQLKGVGDYTASAIASIAFDLPHATVDGNVYRVLSRFFGIDTPINTSKGIREFRSLAQELLDPKQPGNHNQAVMELGALVCTPKRPKCETCPLEEHCYANLAKQTGLFPVKKGKTKVRKRYFNYLVLDSSEGLTRIKKRTGRDIWKHLYEFPLLESAESVADPESIENQVLREFDLGKDYRLKKFNSESVVHKLSHQELHMDFWLIRTDEKPAHTTAWEDLENHALPVPLQNFVDKYKGDS